MRVSSLSGICLQICLFAVPRFSSVDIAFQVFVSTVNFRLQAPQIIIQTQPLFPI